MANTVRFIRGECRIKEENKKGSREIVQWESRLTGASLWSIQTHLQICICIRQDLWSRELTRCTEVCDSLTHASGFPRVQP